MVVFEYSLSFGMLGRVKGVNRLEKKGNQSFEK
jgi:hypothetical protein